MAVIPLNSLAGFSVGSLANTIILANGDISTSNAVFTANIVAGNANLGNLVQANYFQGDGGLLTNISTSGGTSIVNGNSNVTVAANGNVTISVAGVANVVTVTNNNLYRGAYDITGMVYQSNTAPTSPQTGDQWYNTNNGILFQYLNDGTTSQWVDMSGLPYPTITAANSLAVQTNSSTATSVYPTFVSSTANANYALNVVSGISANLANNAIAATTFVGNVSGNLNGYNTATANTAGTVAVRDTNGNVSANFFIGNGSQLTGIITSVSNVSNGTSNLNIPAASGNVNISVAGNANILTVTGTGANVTGTLSATANISAPNVTVTNEVYANILSLNPSGVVLPADKGDFVWDTTAKTAALRLENGELLYLGQETNYLIQANTNLTKGQVVAFAGVTANIILADPANLQAPGFVGDYVIGIIGSDITAGNIGYATSLGQIGNVNTNSFNVGDILYADPATPGGLTNVIPTGANAKVQVGAVLNKNTISGIVLSRTTFFPTMAQLSGVSSTAATNNQYLRYNTTSALWQPANLQISNDPSPNLGANLNANNFSLTSVDDIAANTANFSGAVFSNASVTNPLQLATKQYVDQSTAAGIHIHTPVLVEAPGALTATYAQGGTTPTITTITGGNVLTTSATHNLSVNDIIVFGSTTNGLTAGTAYVVYSVPATNQITLSLSYGPGTQVTGLTNGTGLSITSRANSGVGATLTNAGTQAALVLGSVTMAVNDRVLIYEQTNAYENGVYTVTNTGSGSTNWVLTRATDQNKYAPQSTTGLGSGDYFYVQSGYAAGESYVMTTLGIVILGTTNLTYTLFSAAIAYSGTSPVVVSGQNISLANLTGTGDYVVLANSPALITPNIGAATGTSLNVSTGNVSAGNLNATIANITANVLAGNVWANSGNVNANVYLGGRVSVGGNVDGGDFNPSGNVNVSTGNITVTLGNVTAANLMGPLANGTSNVRIPAAAGNVNISVNGNANILAVTGTGVNVAGTLNATANVSTPQLISTIADGTTPLIVTSTTKVTNLNADLLDGYDTATANTASTVAVRDANGNVSANFFIGNGSQLTGIITSVSNVTNGTSNLNISSSGGNITLAVAGSNVANFSTGGLTLIGTTAFTGNGSGLSQLAGGNVTGWVPNANVANNAVLAATSTGTYYLSLSSATSGNIALAANTNINVAVATGTINATTFVGVHNGNVVANGTGGVVIANNITASGAATGNANVSTVTGNLGIRAIASTYTDNSAAASSTIANAAIHAIGTPTLAASNATVTATNAATFYIASAPTAGTNMTITNPYALYVAAGNAYFGGNAIVNTNLYTPGITTLATNGNLTIDPNGTGNVVITSTTPVVMGNTLTVTGNVTVGSGSTGNITGANVISATTLQGFVVPTAGTTATAPITLSSSGVLTSATTVGAIEYDGTALYGTENSTTGRGEIGIYQAYRYTSAGSALGPTIADYFPATSSINLEASSIYDIECVAYFLKTTTNTVTFTWTNSSAPSLLRSYYVGTVATGFTTTTVTGAPVTGMAVAQSVAAVAHAVTGSLTTAVYHHFHFKVHVVTNAATNLRFRITSATGTVTPQAGSYYIVRKLSANAGNFVA